MNQWSDTPFLSIIYTLRISSWPSQEISARIAPGSADLGTSRLITPRSARAPSRLAMSSAPVPCKISEQKTAIYQAIQPEADPMLDFDERDLLHLAAQAGFFPIQALARSRAVSS